MIAHHSMRRSGRGRPVGCVLPLYPLSTYVSLAFIIAAAVLLVTNLAHVVATIAALSWYVGVAAVALVRSRNRKLVFAGA